MALEREDPSVIAQGALEALEPPPRFPVRWRWTMLVGLVVIVVVFLLSILMLDMERGAWMKNLQAQAEMQVDRLGDDLKIPVLDKRQLDIDLAIDSFLKKVPEAQGVYIETVDGSIMRFGKIDGVTLDLNYKNRDTSVYRLISEDIWYAKKLVYSQVTIGAIGVHYHDDAWQELAAELVRRMMAAAVLAVVLAGALIYWIAGRLSEPLEMLADAAAHVAHGDYNIQLPVRGNDELSDAIGQFNIMVAELAHKEEIRDVFGRYLNPKLVADVFDGGATARAESRRQEVTVLFADMVGFTSFSEITETEEVVEVLNKHFEVFHRIIAYFGGHVDKYIGDAVMAVFNHPKEDPEHVRHAAMAGIAMTMACSKLGVLRKNGEPISFRVGLNRGHAIVGNIGAAERLEYTVIGDTVNIASRMGGLGEGGEVVLSRSSFEAVGSGFDFDEMGLQEIKGVSQSIHCGKVRAVDDDVRHKIAHAVALAFDLTLPSDVRQVIGEVE